jgi:hypothetical protein
VERGRCRREIEVLVEIGSLEREGTDLDALRETAL